MLTEETINDKIEVINNGIYPVVQVRTSTIIRRDGQEISRSYSRETVHPADDISSVDADVAAICTAVFTQAVRDAYASQMATNSVPE